MAQQYILALQLEKEADFSFVKSRTLRDILQETVLLLFPAGDARKVAIAEAKA